MTNCQENRQRICGLLGGLSYVSTVDVNICLNAQNCSSFFSLFKYYNSINQLVSEALMDHSSRIHMVSVDIFQHTRFLEQSAWSQAADYLLEAVHQLVKTGIDFLVICSNTGRRSHVCITCDEYFAC